MMPLALAVVAYQGLAAWDFSLSPLNVKTNLLAMYLGGYAPTLLILIIQCIAGFMRPNEDRELTRQRRERGEQIDQELGIVRKPAWWRRVNGDIPSGGMRDRIMRNVREVGGGRPTTRQIENLAERRAADAETETDAPTRTNVIEMNEMRRTNSVQSSTRGSAIPPPPYTAPSYGGKSDQRRSERAVQVAASLLFPGASPGASVDRGRGLEAESEQPPRRPGTSERSSSTVSGLSTGGPPQQVRSMLDI